MMLTRSRNAAQRTMSGARARARTIGVTAARMPERVFARERTRYSSTDIAMFVWNCRV
jgi:hypothetical protein